ncbi:adenylyltransferase [Anaerocolumna cellulosilytica]|uniref:Adenylyltransferase n=1 Tax=Anaerocolumna cellulosilytica TaxID=433286 RepID=A0A6S6R4T2_9FIRM|nr:aminoglycoside adenylyltransferase domain-containing protein [Anaerocolumna cellulosilytica]MBB5196443.1 streptomycin 3'-adenylyltransferase [Anaerocolumna cellulosilytica]BCJ94435.1 adenylyltransferase [Anaerocolumna cellulosilytica]
MDRYRNLLDNFVMQSKNILGDNLVGIYLHGSAVMGCFNYKKSDIDLLIVIKNENSNEDKRDYMNMVVERNREAPKKGIELSIVKESVCNPFEYPTPFELHFSIAHLNWYQTNPEDYVEKMKGTDKDLAAHIKIIYHRGKTVYGKEIKSVFSEVSREDYMDSIWIDIENAKDEIIKNPMYIILNLCRVLAYKKDNLVLSKQEGGVWGIENIADSKYKKLISNALVEYQTGEEMVLDKSLASIYAEYMLEQIKSA